MFGYIFGFTVFAAAVGFVLELFNGRDKKPVATAVISAIVMGIINTLVIYFVMPPFSHWLSGGWPWMFFINLFVPAFVVLGAGYGDYEWNARGGGIGFGLGVVLLTIYGAIAAFMPPAWCNDTQIKQRFQALNLTPATEAYHTTDLANLIRVPESVALSRAGNALSSGENAALGNYLQPRRAYIQTIQGNVSYVINLQVTNWVAFRQAGEAIPGYLLVDAVDQNAPIEFRLGYQFKYAPTARWGLDLDRRVYADFLLGTGYRIADLDGMEVDDNFNPTYVGTVMSHFMGFQGLKPSGLYLFDPTTGQQGQTTLDEKPTWLDRVYPLDWVKEYVGLWGQFNNHSACSWSNLGQEQLDWANDVATPGGVEYQLTLTSMGVEPSLTRLVSFDPTTGEGKIYAMTGKTIQGITTLIEQSSKTLNPTGFVADECEIHRILNRNTAYCILTSTYKAADGMVDVSIGGYAFVDINQAMNNNLEDVAIAKTFDEAYFKYQEVVARVGGDADLSSTQSDIQVVGTVQTNTWVQYGGEAGSFLIGVLADDGQTYWVLARGSSLNAAAAQPGAKVTATCYQQTGQNFLTVRVIRIEGVPDLDQK